MTDRIMAILGEYEFSIDTAAYQELTRTTAYRWASQPRLGRLPALQFMGPGEDSISLSGVIYPHFKGGLNQIDQMREAANQGEPLTLVIAPSLTADILGDWVIESIAEGQTVFMPGGIPKQMTFELSLKLYGEDDAVSN